MKLAELFDHYGTDKARNGYHNIYRHLFDDRARVRSVLEVGIGTLNPDAHSTMVGYGADHYKPGGSLRAWRDWFPNAEIVGVDTQPDTQFTEDRITTALADSTNADQLNAALGERRFDLIIDDADHNVTAQTAALHNLWPRLRPNGYYVIEDINDPAALTAAATHLGHITTNPTGTLMAIRHD